jgi:hypothetical protein
VGTIIADAFFFVVGFLTLWVLHQNRAKVNSVLQENYNGSYRVAGIVHGLNFIAVMGVLVLTVFLVAFLLKRFLCQSC